MKKIEIVGYQRANLGRTESQAIRAEGNVPCVLYGGQEQVHFYAPAILFRELLYSPNIYEVALNIEGAEYRAILQEAQFHPVSDALLHADFLLVADGKSIKISVPVRTIGVAPGVQKGGKLITRVRKLRVKGLIENIPDFIDVDVSNLDLGKSVRVGQIPVSGIEMLEEATNPVASIEIPRSLRGTVGK
ncbi:50S ribosomal protein L25/general stress protein Ctc [Spirosoma utsteinense]|uniref:Large ribosomal subunit protein bL25 n=1 Tax=Spirosoma utsteinense TaxID=2585773 RepID=A0ABR6W637_9BACT|nr:50S ribosomal protein L25/general stress protein Ctc [Spirosoma utsteinense]MBC3785540.1 large subunit ribosomal protein L25 [Spirosoma utsteinense]MBC3791689.1 large subunit ribosomal protein L25 [Spirosoma utsteinense]